MTSPQMRVRRRVWMADAAITVYLLLFYLTFAGVSIQHARQSDLSDQGKHIDEYHFTVDDGMTGVDLWINDVYIGQTPVVIDVREFRDKVQPVSQPPQNATEGLSENKVRYMGFNLNKNDASLRRGGFVESQDYAYYARVSFNGFEGYGSIGQNSSSSSSNGQISIKSTGFDIQVDFPVLQKRAELLLDQARLNNYIVDEDWIEGLESLGDLAWKALYYTAYRQWFLDGTNLYNKFSHIEPMVTEPGLITILDQWASLRFGLDQIDDPESAWQAFLRVKEEATLSGYTIADITGHALRMLIPRLDTTQFTRWACQQIQELDQGSSAYQLLLGWKPALQGINLWQNRWRSSDAFVVDAIWFMDQYLDQQNDRVFNSIEEDVCEQILVQHFPTYPQALLFAARLGGEGVDRVFERAWRRSQKGDPRFIQTQSFWGTSISEVWLFLLAHLDNEAGRMFRQSHADDMLSLVQSMLTENPQNPQGNLFCMGELDFFTLDTDRGSDCVGARLWPRLNSIFKSLKDDYGNTLLQKQWKCLLLVEPSLPLETYVECWQENVEDSDRLEELLGWLEAVEVKRRQNILELLIADTRDRLAQFSENDKNEMERLLQKMRRALALTSEERYEVYIANSLQRADSDQRSHLKQEIREDWQWHPYPAILAGSTDREIRLLAVDLIASYPVGDTIRYVEELQHDSDDIVCQAAQEVLDELQSKRAQSWQVLNNSNVPVKTQRSRQVSLQARIYDLSLESSDRFKPVTLSGRFVERRLSSTGQEDWSGVDLQLDRIKRNGRQDRRMIVLDPNDQNDVAVQAWLGHCLYTWLPGFNPQGVFDRGNKPRPQALSEPTEVTILDAYQSPIPAAKIHLVLRDGNREFRLRVPVGTTDAKGMIVLPALSSWSSQAEAIYVSHPDYGQTQIRIGKQRLTDVLRTSLVRLDGESSQDILRGRVLDDSGRPMGQARVSVVSQDRLRSGRPLNPQPSVVFTDNQGIFTLVPDQEAEQEDHEVEYLVRVDAPESLGLPYWTTYRHEEDIEIVMGQGWTQHRFQFEDANGLITDPNVLKQIHVSYGGAQPRRFYQCGDYWLHPVSTPLGSYRASHKNLCFQSVELDANSPETVTFASLPMPSFTGRVVHGITGEPLKGVFVSYDQPFNDNLYSDINDAQWEILHQWGQSPQQTQQAEAFLRTIQDVHGLTRTSAAGRFCLQTNAKTKDDDTLSFFDQDYMAFYRSKSDMDERAANEYDTGDIKLFPAARVKLGLNNPVSIEICPFPVVAEDAPQWAQAFQRYASFSYHRWHRIREPRSIFVPAGVTFQLKLYAGKRWIPLLIDTPVYLEQGQEMDLGRVTLERVPNKSQDR